MTALSADRPFPGLRPFAFADRDYFFGRRDQSFAVYRLVAASRFVAVVGSSGGGKSSLVRAGLRGLLAEETETEGGKDWRCTEMRPGAAPLERLAEALAALADDTDAEIAKARKDRVHYLLRQSSFGLDEALPEIGVDLGKSLLLVVDQFEELFRFGLGELGGRRDPIDAARRRDEAAQFVRLLLDSSRRKLADIHVLITMRSDFMGECAHFHGLPEAVSGMQYLVPNLTRDQLEATIKEPVAKAGGRIESALVERLLNDIDEENDPLPVLQHCLMRLWSHARSATVTTRELTLADYRDIGGLEKALSQHADELLNDFKGREVAVEQLMRALAEVDREGRATRRWLMFSQARAESGVTEQDLRDVCDRFRSDDYSFLTPPLSSTPVLSDETVLDFGHEAILRRWRKVAGDPDTLDPTTARPAVGWLRDEERDGQRYRALLSMLDANGNGAPPANIEEWSEWWNRRPRTAAWSERYGGQFAHAKRLIETGVAQKRQEEQAAQERKRERRRSRTRQIVLSIALLLALLAASSTFLSRERERRLEAANDEARLQAAHTLLGKVLDDLNSGEIKAKGADDLSETTEGLLAHLGNGSPGVQSVRAQLLIVEADIAARTGKRAKSLVLAKQAEAYAIALTQVNPPDPRNLQLLYSSQVRIGEALSRSRSRPEQIEIPLAAFESARSTAQLLKARQPEDIQWRHDLLDVQLKIGDLKQDSGDLKAAIALIEDSLTIAQEMFAAHSTDDWRREVGKVQYRLGRAFQLYDRPQDAKSHLLAAEAEQEKLVEKNPKDPGLNSNLSATRSKLADLLIGLNDIAGAERVYRDAIQLQEKSLAADSSNLLSKSFVVPKYLSFSDFLDRQGRSEAAKENAKKASVLAKELWDADEMKVDYADLYAAAGYAYATHLNGSDRVEALRRAVAGWQSVMRSNSSASYLKESLPNIVAMADEFETQQNWADARSCYEIAKYVIDLKTKSDVPTNLADKTDWRSQSAQVERHLAALNSRIAQSASEKP